MKAAFGNGCAHCEPGTPITKVQCRGVVFRLCLSCTLGWFPGRGADWFEERHAPFRDHTRSARQPEKGLQLEWQLSPS